MKIIYLPERKFYIMEDFNRLVKLCQGKNVYIQTHNFPDPDAIASAFGLQRLLAHFGVTSTLCYAGRIDKLSSSKMLTAFGIQMVSYEELREHMQEQDPIICVDSQKNSGNITDFVGDEIACIDHHPTFVQTEYLYRDVRITGACASLIAQYFQRLGMAPDVNAATALLYGIRMDTLQFSRGATSLDIEMFSYLFPLSDTQKMLELERNNIELTDLRAYSEAINTITLYDTMGFASIPFSCPDGLIAALSDFLLSLEEVLVSVVLCHRGDGIKLSVRSEVPQVHAGYLIRDALTGIGDGGGHQEMAGGMVRREQEVLLGQYPDDILRDRFLRALEKNTCE